MPINITHAAARFVDRVRRDIKALAILIEWLGSGGVPVTFELANERAKTCSQCPKNGPVTKSIENTTAEAIRRHEAVRNATQLRTNYDTRIHNCGVCQCYLKLKVWVPLDHLKDDPGIFPENCWIPREHRARNQPPPEVAPGKSQPMLPTTPVIRIKREAAFGDVIQASILATKLHALGYKVLWRSNDISVEALKHHPHIERFIEDPKAPVDVNLDDTYESNMERKKKSLAQMFIEASDHQLTKLNIRPLSRINTVPHLALTPEEIEAMRKRLESIPRPLVAYVPKSGFWKARQINPDVVNESAKLIKASVVWAFPTKAPTNDFHDINGPKSFRELMALIYHSDVVVTPDTGPLHVATAFNKPIVIIQQCIRADLRLTMQSDWTAVNADLKCLPCGEFICPVDKETPPCQWLPPQRIADAVNQKLETLTGDSVSVIIPVYKVGPRLSKSYAAAREQVEEVIIALDGAETAAPPETKTVQCLVPSPGARTGFGKTCMRGAHASKGSFLLFLNDDCYLKPGCVDAMVDTMRRNPKCAVVGAQLWYPDGTLQHGGTGRVNGDIGFGHLDWKRKVPSVRAEKEMEFVTFACALVRRSAFYSVRGFDEEYDTYCEDSDLCLRLRQAGWKVFYNPAAKAIHDESQTTGPEKSKLHSDAHAIFERKWFHYFQRNPAPK
jgi:GT2 family glycosyltransferase/ADP-heptose:LPS heptosyltransferase